MGRFTLSLDFELGWGALETGLWKPRQETGVYKNLRSALKQLLDVLDDHEISLTWATVGAMIDDPKNTDFSHLPKTYEILAQDFVTNSHSQTHDGRDLFDLILNTKTRQDIGSHTYSHTRFSAQNYSRSAKANDLKNCNKTFAQYGLTPKSFVYPLNHASDFDLLFESGIRLARLAPNSSKTKAGKLIEKCLATPLSAKRQKTDTGLMTETGSFLYNWGVKGDRHIRRILINKQIGAAMARSANSDFHTHIWLHPFNLVEVSHLLNDLLKILRKAAKLRDQGNLTIVPMIQNENSI